MRPGERAVISRLAEKLEALYQASTGAAATTSKSADVKKE